MSEPFADRIHPPTPRRLQQARQEGRVARSQDLVVAVALCGAVGVLLLYGGDLVRFFVDYAGGQLGGEAWVSIDADLTVFHWRDTMSTLGKILLPLLLLLVALAVVGNVSQTGWLWLPQKLALDWNRIHPAQGARRLFSGSGLWRLGMGICKAAMIAGVAAWSLWADRDRLLELPGMASSVMAAVLVETVLWTGLKMAAALLVLAVLDYAMQRWRHQRDLRMTNEELREELRHEQGDPAIIKRRQQMPARQMTEQATREVQHAELVIAQGKSLVVALRYDARSMPAPQVIAKGTGRLAETILDAAQRRGVSICQRDELARSLWRHTPLRQTIPAELYAAVAQLISVSADG